MWILVISFCTSMNAGKVACASVIPKLSFRSEAQCVVYKNASTRMLEDTSVKENSNMVWKSLTCDNIGVAS